MLAKHGLYHVLFFILITTFSLTTGILLQNPHQISTSAFLRSCRDKCSENVKEFNTCDVPLPRHYVTHHLNGSVITVDGRLDEDAWKEVPWTENFVDIRGSQFPAPPVDTKVKIRWDDKFVYVGAYLQEPHVWATYTQKDTRIYQENAFEVFFDVDSSMSMYKEIEINALGTTWDLIMSRAYMDGGDWDDWEGIQQKAAYTDGLVNNASVPATFWSVEISFPFSNLSENTTRTPGPAAEGEMWFMELARPRYTLEPLKNFTYEKKPGTDASWYAWSPTGAVNLHLPSKWGLLYFTKSAPQANTLTPPPRWLTYRALFDVFDALVAFKAQRGTYVDIVSELNLPIYITSISCFNFVDIYLKGDGFTVTIVSKNDPGVKGHITEDRHVWFTTV